MMRMFTVHMEISCVWATPFLLFLLNLAMAATKELRPGYYSKTCPQAELLVRNVIKKSMAREPRSAASVMRLQFSFMLFKCFVGM
nr:Peroxidase 17 [Ipomoea batatas]